MNVFDGKTNLRKPAKDMVLIKKLFFRFLLGDGFGEISTLCVLHHNFEFVVLGDVHFPEVDDIGMLEVTENLCLFHGFLFFLGRHVLDVHLLNDQQLVCWLVPHEISLTEGSFAQQLLFDIDFVFVLNDFNIHACRQII